MLKGDRGFYLSSSEDDATWEVQTTPLINAFTFGWTEDGRCGYEGEKMMQKCPQPLPGSVILDAQAKHKKYVYKSVAAGNLHTLFVVIDSGKQSLQEGSGLTKYNAKTRKSVMVTKRNKKLLLCGLNQMMLCEEPSVQTPTEVILPDDIGSLKLIAANNGASYFTTKYGQVFSFGNNKFGKLGYDTLTDEDMLNSNNQSQPLHMIPRCVMSLNRKKIRKIATMCTAHHVLALTEDNQVYSWGRNDKGQLGIGHESSFESTPSQVTLPRMGAKAKVMDMGAGREHSAILVQHTHRTLKKDVATLKSMQNSLQSSSFQHLQERLTSSEAMGQDKLQKQISSKFNDNDEDYDISYDYFVYSFGCGDRGQLGSGENVSPQRASPQENVWLSKLLKKMRFELTRVVCGGEFTMCVVKDRGQVIVWGANSYGQLGLGHQHDSPEPTLIPSLSNVLSLSAGERHCLASCHAPQRGLVELFSWGYNNWGELGLGDCDVRLSPTKISAFKLCLITGLACGNRHSAVLTSPRSLKGGEISSLKPLFALLLSVGEGGERERRKKKGERKESEEVKRLRMRLKKRLEREGGLPPSVLDDPEALLPFQPGSSLSPLANEVFERGLRYCLDTLPSSTARDWRRGAMEVCFRAPFSPSLSLQSVCLSCARRCLRSARLVPYLRHRGDGVDPSLCCDCSLSGKCRCRWSRIREAFDSFLGREKKGEKGKRAKGGGAEVEGGDGGGEETLPLSLIPHLLKKLRAPFPLEGGDIDEASLFFTSLQQDAEAGRERRFKKPVDRSLFKGYRHKGGEEESMGSGSISRENMGAILAAEGDETGNGVRVDPIDFERWYRQFYDEPEKEAGLDSNGAVIGGGIISSMGMEEDGDDGET